MTGSTNDNSATTDTPQTPAQPALGETMIVPPETVASLPAALPDDVERSICVGKSLGKYQITGVLGKGGMGVVLKARDPLIERDVAIKVLAEHLADDATALERFLAEARAAGQINHPHIVGIFEIGQQDRAHFLVMEYLPGGSLGERLEREGRLSVLEATRAVVDACKGIAAAHAAGLIHRDLKPANFMRAADGSVKVADFGLAKAAATQGKHLTQAGTVIGTPFFMSPEQCQGAPADVRSDIYSLGAAYYSLLTAKYPYQDSGSVPQVMFAHCHADIPDPRRDDASIPPACSRIIARAMAKVPEERYQSAQEMLGDLELVSATLSGQTLTALPSDSRSHPVLAPFTSAPASPPVRPAGRRTAIAIGGAVLVALLAGLVVSRPWDRAGSETGTVAPIAATTEPILVGLLHSLSGTMADSEEVVVDATLFAIEEINRSGGVLGRPLKAIIADGRSDPDVFAREAERLITAEQVSVIFGCWTSASRKTVKGIVEDHDHLLVYPLQYEGLETSPNIVYMGSAPNQQILPAIEWAVSSLGKKRFFLVGSDYVFPRAAHEIIKDDLQRRGMAVVGESYLPLGSSDVEATVGAIVEARPDMILNTLNGDSNVAFFRALRQAGVTSADCPTLSFSIDEAGLSRLRLEDIIGDYAAWTYFEAVDTPENREFVARFHERYPQRRVTDPMEAAYVGLTLWARAANEAGGLEPRKVRRAMLEQRFAAPGGEVRIDADTQHCYKIPRIGQIDADGSFQIVWEAPEPVAPDPYPSSRTAEEWRAFLHDLYTGWGNRWSAP